MLEHQVLLLRCHAVLTWQTAAAGCGRPAERRETAGFIYDQLLSELCVYVTGNGVYR
jgi:hypothetical protein